MHSVSSKPKGRMVPLQSLGAGGSSFCILPRKTSGTLNGPRFWRANVPQGLQVYGEKRSYMEAAIDVVQAPQNVWSARK